MSSENRGEDSVVTDPERPEAKQAEPDTMRPIPDGGLQQSMPEWLRRPPAWRNLPKREEPAKAEPPVTVPAREPLPAQLPVHLPEPDTSEIDPRSLVDIADLPQWLQDLATRSDALSSPPVTTDEPDSSATEEQVMTDPQRPVDEGRVEDVRTVQFEPVDKKRWETPDEETKVYGGPKPAGQNWPVLIGAALVILVIVALIVMLLL
jgi:hypothetical protein